MKTVFFDVDMQMDFLCPAGALYVPGAEAIVNTVARLNRHAAANGITVISTVDAHAEDDPEFRIWPAHCVAGTAGQRKHPATLLERRVTVENRDYEWSLEGAQQVILEKQTTDVFKTVNVLRVLEALQADRYVVYGVVTEICVSAVAFGLSVTRKPVSIVFTAVEGLSAEASMDTLETFQAMGGMLVTAEEICTASE